MSAASSPARSRESSTPSSIGEREWLEADDKVRQDVLDTFVRTSETYLLHDCRCLWTTQGELESTTCGAVFMSRLALEKHVEQHYDSIRRIVQNPKRKGKHSFKRCHWHNCASEFRHKRDLIRHFSKEHVAKHVSICPFISCPVRSKYVNPSNLRDHLQAHHCDQMLPHHLAPASQTHPSALLRELPSFNLTLNLQDYPLASPDPANLCPSVRPGVTGEQLPRRMVETVNKRGHVTMVAAAEEKEGEWSFMDDGTDNGEEGSEEGETEQAGGLKGGTSTASRGEQTKPSKKMATRLGTTTSSSSLLLPSFVSSSHTKRTTSDIPSETSADRKPKILSVTPAPSIHPHPNTPHSPTQHRFASQGSQTPSAATLAQSKHSNPSSHKTVIPALIPARPPPSALLPSIFGRRPIPSFAIALPPETGPTVGIESMAWAVHRKVTAERNRQSSGGRKAAHRLAEVLPDDREDEEDDKDRIGYDWWSME